MHEIIPTAHELMEMHVEALFTHDRRQRLRAVNEPWPGAAPAARFFLGRTVEGTAVCRFRHDVPDPLVEQLEAGATDETADYRAKPKRFEAYMSLLQAERFTMGPCYLVPAELTPTIQTIRITRENVAELSRGGFEWLVSEIDFAQPCIALVRDGRAVSVCRSVRITPEAHEAGLETLERHRGNGYGAEVVAGWAAAVRGTGCLPLYSTSWDNAASRSVARKTNLVLYGANFIIP